MNRVVAYVNHAAFSPRIPSRQHVRYPSSCSAAPSCWRSSACSWKCMGIYIVTVCSYVGRAYFSMLFYAYDGNDFDAFKRGNRKASDKCYGTGCSKFKCPMTPFLISYKNNFLLYRPLQVPAENVFFSRKSEMSKLALLTFGIGAYVALCTYAFVM